MESLDLNKENCFEAQLFCFGKALVRNIGK